MRPWWIAGLAVGPVLLALLVVLAAVWAARREQERPAVALPSILPAQPGRHRAPDPAFTASQVVVRPYVLRRDLLPEQPPLSWALENETMEVMV